MQKKKKYTDECVLLETHCAGVTMIVHPIYTDVLFSEIIINIINIESLIYSLT